MRRAPPDGSRCESQRRENSSPAADLLILREVSSLESAVADSHRARPVHSGRKAALGRELEGAIDRGGVDALRSERRNGRVHSHLEQYELVGLRRSGRAGVGELVDDEVAVADRVRQPSSLRTDPMIRPWPLMVCGFPK